MSLESSMDNKSNQMREHFYIKIGACVGRSTQPHLWAIWGVYSSYIKRYLTKSHLTRDWQAIIDGFIFVKRMFSCMLGWTTGWPVFRFTWTVIPSYKVIPSLCKLIIRTTFVIVVEEAMREGEECGVTFWSLTGHVKPWSIATNPVHTNQLPHHGYYNASVSNNK